MTGLNSKLFARIITRNREIYLLKIITLATAFATSVLIILFSLNEYGYDRFHKDPYALFRLLERNINEQYEGNRLSAKIPPRVVDHLNDAFKKSLLIARVKIMHEITVILADKRFEDQTVHAVDPAIKHVFSFDMVDGDAGSFALSKETVVMLSAEAAQKYTGSSKSAGKKIKLYTFGDTIEARVIAVFRDFPKNTHEHFDVLIAFGDAWITSLNFHPEETGVYGRALAGKPQEYQTFINKTHGETGVVYEFQPLPEVYFGPRVLGEDAKHGDRYSVTILVCIAGLILFLALTTFINLTTLTLPYRSKEIAVRKLAGVSQASLVYAFLKESFLLTGVSLVIGLSILLLTSSYIEPMLDLYIPALVFKGDASLMLTVAVLFIILAIAPVFMTRRFVQASPNRLLSTDTITFPKFKRVITFLQLGISIFLIIASLVVRRQIDYSLLKEPGRNHDQVVYLNCPSGLTNEGVHALRSSWKRFNPNIVDVMAVSQLPDRLSSKEVGSTFYSLQVDPGFLEFFGLKMQAGNWFRVNAGDSIIVTNKIGSDMMGNTSANVIGVIEDLSGQFNQPEKPVKIRLAPDYNYNWLCVRVLEVDIRRTVRQLADDFSTGGEKAYVHFLDSHFESWLDYQDRLNVLSGILAVISGLLSCFAIYGLSVSLVRDKLKQIAVHKLYGAHTVHITRLLVMEFATQMLLALIVFGPLTYIFLNELLRTFVYATKLSWLDPVYPIAYCAFIITTLCGFQALSLNRSDLTTALKG
jgi:putative ABC transport system permease protein